MWLLELLCTISVLLKAFLTTVMFIVLQWFFGEWKCKTINTHSKHTCQQEKWKSNFKTSKLQFQTVIFLQFHTLTLFSCYKTFHFEKERSKCFQHFLPQFKQINLLPCLKQKSPFNEKIHAWLSNQNESKRKLREKNFLLFKCNTLFYKSNFFKWDWERLKNKNNVKAEVKF